MNVMAEIGHSSDLARFVQSMVGHRFNGGAQPGSGKHIMFKTTDLHRTLTAAIAAVLVSFTFIGAAVGPVGATASTHQVTADQSQSA